MKHTRTTSRAAYDEIRRTGTLSKQRWLVYRALYHNGPLTSRELDQLMAKPDEAAASYHKRLSELERLGVAGVVGKKTCTITGMKAQLWDVTDSTPKPREKKKRCPHCNQPMRSTRT